MTLPESVLVGILLVIFLVGLGLVLSGRRRWCGTWPWCWLCLSWSCSCWGV